METPIKHPKDMAIILRTQRIKTDTSQEDLASAIGKSRYWVMQTESGKTTPGLDSAIEALKALGLELVVRPVPPLDLGTMPKEIAQQLGLIP